MVIAIAMKLAKPAKLNPFHIATQIYNQLSSHPMIGAVEVVHPGFINFRLKRAYIEQMIAGALADPRLGVPSVETPRQCCALRTVRS